MAAQPTPAARMAMKPAHRSRPALGEMPSFLMFMRRQIYLADYRIDNG